MGWRTGLLLLLGLLAQGAVAEGKGEDITDLRARHAAAPGDTEAGFRLARALSAAGSYGEAEQVYRDILVRAPENPDYLLGLGQVLLWSGRPAEAVPWLEKARDAAPDYEDVRTTLARAMDASRQDGPAARDADGPRTYGYLTHRLVLLSDNPEDWHDTRFELGYSPRRHASLGIFAMDSERFNLDDETLGLYGAYPVLEGTNVYVEASFSPDHRVLPANSAYLQVNQALGAGFGVLAGIRRVEYTESLVHVGDLTLERYFGNFRAAYTAFPAHSDVAGDTLSHRLQLSRYMDGGSHVSLAFATGSEVEKPVDARTVLETDFNAVSLWGRVRLTPALGLTWSADYTDLELPNGQDSKRKGFNLGLEYDF